MKFVAVTHVSAVVEQPLNAAINILGGHKHGNFFVWRQACAVHRQPNKQM